SDPTDARRWGRGDPPGCGLALERMSRIYSQDARWNLSVRIAQADRIGRTIDNDIEWRRRRHWWTSRRPTQERYPTRLAPVSSKRIAEVDRRGENQTARILRRQVIGTTDHQAAAGR